MLKIYTHLRFIVFLFFCGLFWQGCNIINPHEQNPTYIHIDSFSLVDDYKDLALPHPLTNRHQITCVWVYYNNASVGVFDLPATFPVFASGTGTLEVFPGVEIDGQNDLLAINPFYQPDTFDFTAQPGKILNHECTTKYYSAIKVNPLDDFSSQKFGLDGGNIEIASVSDSENINGPHGRIVLGAIGDSSIDSLQVPPFSIPTGSAFIQFDYKSTLPFYVGLRAIISGVSTTPYYLSGIYPTNTWQTFYLSVQDFAAQYGASTATYNFFIKTSTLPQGTTGTLLIDNIQLITY